MVINKWAESAAELLQDRGRENHAEEAGQERKSPGEGAGDPVRREPAFDGKTIGDEGDSHRALHRGQRDGWPSTPVVVHLLQDQLQSGELLETLSEVKPA